MANQISVRRASPDNPKLSHLYVIYEGAWRVPGTKAYIHEIAMDLAQKYAYARNVGYHREAASYVAAGMVHQQRIASNR